MRRFLALVAATLVAAVLIPLTPAPSGAGATTDVYLVHGLNLEAQTSQGEGGDPVTVCVDGAPLLGDFQFGDVFGPVPQPSGVTLEVTVVLGVDQECDSLNDGFTDEVTPEGEAMAVVATGAEGGRAPVPVLQPFPLDVSCTDAGFGRLTGAHAALAGEVDLAVDDTVVASIAFGESFGADLPTDLYSVAVEDGGVPVVGPADVAVGEQLATTVFVVGGLPFFEGEPPVDEPVIVEPVGLAPAGLIATPLVPLFLDVEVALCATPTTPTTAAPTPNPTAAAATAAPATPRFTG